MIKKAFKFCLLTAIILLLAISNGCGSNDNVNDNGSEGAAVADVPSETEIVKIGDEVITEGQLRDYMVIMAHNAGKKLEDYEGPELEEFRETALESLITNTLVRRYMEEDVGIAYMTQEIAMSAEQIGAVLRTDEALLKAVKDNGVSNDMFEKYIAFVQYSDWFYTHTKEGLDLSEEVLTEYYEKNRDDLLRTYVGVSHIVVATFEEAEEILRKLENGEDFAELAKEFSLDTATKDDGGALPHFGRNETLAEFEDAAFSLEIGEISGPIRTMYGYHIMRVDDRYQDELEFDIVGRYIEDVLVKEACNEKIRELRRESL